MSINNYYKGLPIVDLSGNTISCVVIFSDNESKISCVIEYV